MLFFARRTKCQQHRTFTKIRLSIIWYLYILSGVGRRRRRPQEMNATSQPLCWSVKCPLEQAVRCCRGDGELLGSRDAESKPRMLMMDGGRS